MNRGNIAKSFEGCCDWPVLAAGGKQVAGLFNGKSALPGCGEFRCQETVVARFALRFHRLNTKPGECLVHSAGRCPFVASLENAYLVRKCRLFQLVLQRD